MVVAEVAHVKAEAAVLSQRDQPADLVHAGRSAVRRHAHDLVFAFVDLKAQKGREGAVQQAQRVRIADLVRYLQVNAVADAEGGGRPLADPVRGQHGRFVEWRREEGARRMREVVFTEQDLAGIAECLANLTAYPQLLPQPGLHGIDEGAA